MQYVALSEKQKQKMIIHKVLTKPPFFSNHLLFTTITTVVLRHTSLESEA